MAKKVGRTRAAMTQVQPGLESAMTRKPKFDYIWDGKRGGRLQGKVAVVTGGDSGIGRAVSVAYAAEGAHVVILFKEGKEEKDAETTRDFIRRKYRRAPFLLGCNLASEDSCRAVADEIKKRNKRVDVLVNNAAIQFERDTLQDITAEQLRLTFETNIFSMFYLTQALLPIMKSGSCIINSASVTAFRGSDHLIDYASTKGAIVAFTRSLASNLAEKKIRVNGVAPGPVLTPLVHASFTKAHLDKFGKDTAMGRPAQPNEIAPAYVFLACEDSSYITGQFIHPNGGEIVNT